MYHKSLIPCILTLTMVFSYVRSDFSQDKKQCQDQLISLSPCITFVSGDAKAPTPACCTELRRNADKSKYCLCVLVKDRDEPGLGFKLNATRAIGLVPLCRVDPIASMCPELLHLPPNSPDAKFFEQLGNMSSVGNTTTAGETVPNSSTRSSVEGTRRAIIVITILFSISAVFSL